MKKQYISPTAELILLVPIEEITTNPRSWEWGPGLQNYWGSTITEVPSGTTYWWDFGTAEIDPD